MGDRLNVIIDQGEGDHPVVAYSHWGGTTLLDGALDRAIEAAKPRAGDPHYFTAMLVAELVHEELLSGLGTSLDDHQTGYVVPLVSAETGERRDLANVSEANRLIAEHRLTPRQPG